MEVLKAKSKNLVKTIISAILQGKVLALPTDTVYGLITDATNRKAVRKVFRIKKRKTQKPLPVFVRDIKTVRRLVEISKKEEKFLKKVWPGKVTLVFKRRKSPLALKILSTGEKSIALRVPDGELLKTILKKLGRPLTGTSANVSGFSACLTAGEVVKTFRGRKDQPDFVLEGFCQKHAKPSTVIDLTKGKPKVLRRGSFPAAEFFKMFK